MSFDHQQQLLTSNEEGKVFYKFIVSDASRKRLQVVHDVVTELLFQYDGGPSGKKANLAVSLCKSIVNIGVELVLIDSEKFKHTSSAWLNKRMLSRIVMAIMNVLLKVDNSSGLFPTFFDMLLMSLSTLCVQMIQSLRKVR